MNRALTLSLAGLATMTLVAGASLAHAEDAPSPKGGAVKGAVVGGVAGHMMGGHTKTGAAIGAVAGHHEKVKSQERIDAGGKP
jgi:hypothetical protein